MNYSLKILPRAEHDFLRIFAYIEKRSPEGAERWKQAFHAGVKRLEQNPLVYGFAPEAKQFRFELRQLLFKTRYGRTYRTVYRIDGDSIIVFRICGPGQAPLGPGELSTT